jgi:hypothetical protein
MKLMPGDSKKPEEATVETLAVCSNSMKLMPGDSEKPEEA